MDRIRLLSLSLILTLLTISACSIFTPFSAPTQVNPYNDFIQTIVVQTLTAFPYPTLQPSLTSSLTSSLTLTATLNVQSPQGFISYYFGNINSRNYTLTWSLLTDRFKNRLNLPSQGGYQGYVDFWNTINQVTVLNVYDICQVDLCAIDATLQFFYKNGQHTTDTYPYTLTYDHTRNSWLFDYVPANTATPTRTFTATATRTRTPSITPTSTASKTTTPSPSRTPTRTVSPTRTGSTTPSQTRSPTTTLIHSPTFTWTPSGIPTATMTPTFTPTVTYPFTPTSTASETYTEVPSVAPTATMTPTLTPTEFPSATASRTPSETPTSTATTGP